MDLSQIRARLSADNTQRYASPEEYVADVYLMFRNCAKFNYVSTQAVSYYEHSAKVTVCVRDDNMVFTGKWMDCVYIVRFCNQWPPKALYNIA